MSRIHLLTVTRFAAVLAIVLPALGLLGFGGTPAAAAAQATPNIAVTLTSDAEALAAGERITYTAEITNRGEAVQARVVLSPPAYVSLGEIEDAEVDGNEATWTLALGATETQTIEIPARIGDIPQGELRATALLSLYVGDAPSPLVRTASADLIDGVDDVQTEASPLPGILLVVGSALVVALIGLAVVFIVLQRRRRAAEEAAKREAWIGYARRESPPVDAEGPETR
ncbi:hypothetical protein [Microbacterium sp. NPDC090003]|uniref:hypothetical protein n=1 Tax=Microbacterium sp. NPDC090003 TaxID=3364203 RepID=UPI00382CEDFF